MFKVLPPVDEKSLFETCASCSSDATLLIMYIFVKLELTNRGLTLAIAPIFLKYLSCDVSF